MEEKFKLVFGNDGTGEKDIDEPFGYNEISFNLEQNENGHARDNSFNGGSFNLTFTKERNHCLDYLLYYFDFYKTESKVKFIITIDGYDNIIGDLDFINAKTDEIEYFTCKVIESNEFQIMKRRSDAEVDLFSNKTLDKEPIEPARAYNILVKAKANVVESKWEQQSAYTKEWKVDIRAQEEYIKVLFVSFAPFNALTLGDINSSAGSLDLDNHAWGHSQNTPENRYRYNSGENLWIIKATDNLQNIKVKISEFYLKLESYYTGNDSFAEEDKDKVIYRLAIRRGTSLATATYVPLLQGTIIGENTVVHSKGFSFTLDKLDRGEFLWVLVETDIIVYRRGSNYYDYNCLVDLKNMNIEASAESLAYNSITKGVRLIDSIKQVTKSVSGLNVIAPDFDYEGHLYDNFLLNGSLLRRNLDVPFNLSLKTISDGLKEFNADFEVNKNVFFGLEKDFYRDEECFFFDHVQFSEFEKSFNQKYAINIFEYKFKKHQSLKEKEQPNSSDTVQGEAKLLLANKMTENSRSIDVDWIRDSFLLDEARKKAYEISKDTSYQNDTDVFILDCIKNDKDLEFIEATELYHEWVSGNNRLFLKSRDELNFIILGIESNSIFEIQNDANAGTYNVEKVSSQQLILRPIIVGVMQSANDGKRYTKYKYILKKEQVHYISRTNEGLVGDGVKSLESYANLRYSVKRNILNYYQSYLATCNLANFGKEISVNEYLHNRDCVIDVDGLHTKESDSITPTNPVLSLFLYENVVFANVSMRDFINLQKAIREKRGYIRTINNLGHPIKIYPKKLSYIKERNELTIIEAEEKFELDYIKITVNATFVIFNGSVKLLKRKWTDNNGWEVIDNKVSLFDIRGYRYFKPVYWHKVSINGHICTTLEDFKVKMKLIN